MDAAVIEPIPGTGKGLAIACGLATHYGDPHLGGDPYVMALAAIDECVRNLVCIGADPSRVAILDNFCWPSCKKPANLASLVRAAEGCYDGAKAYKTPFISGKDSLNNQFTIPAKDGTPGRTVEIPPTLLITGIGAVADVNACVTMDVKRPGNILVHVAQDGDTIGEVTGLYRTLFDSDQYPACELDRSASDRFAATAAGIARLVRSGIVASIHDVSDGGVLCALAEMLIAGSTDADPIGADLSTDDSAALFAERPGEYVLEVTAGTDIAGLERALPPGVRARTVATLDTSGTLTGAAWSVRIEDLAAAWLGTVRA